MVTVPEGIEGERVDIALTRILGLSRSQAATILSAGGVTSGAKVLSKSDRVSADQVLDINMDAAPSPEPIEIVAEPVPGMTIVFDDNDIVVVDKPPGVAAHPSRGWDGPTVIGGLAAAGFAISTSGAPEREGIVHRLDAGTSGLMAVAKNELAYSRMKNLFRHREVHKVYHAVVQGLLDPLVGTVDAAIGRHPGHEYKYAVTTAGKPSITHYETLEAFRHASLLSVDLETGRTHQIRVHMSAMRHPIVGDTMYGGDPVLAERLGLNRQWLHAVELSFDHPRTGERVELTSTYSEDLVRALDILRG
ncbi:MAG: RluA family pseudouridine synthase [Candidatus Nanopelagicales bacterium]|nr:RluA family pseudouridine synthase [Candidatus Nanopelagicales bacterium]MCF8539887.1 RluA family pseudouridine synthase [Candidatus Nanopelagicales bacterium]